MLNAIFPSKRFPTHNFLPNDQLNLMERIFSSIFKRSLLQRKWSLTVSLFYVDFINASVGRGDSSHFPHIYDYAKTRGAGIVCSSVMVVPHMTFMHSEYP